MKKILLVMMGAVVCSGTVLAKTVKWRIDVSSPGYKVAMKYDSGSDGVNGSNASWMKGNADKRLVISGVPSPTWSQVSFSFIPKKSGMVMLNLMGSARKDKGFVAYDNFSVEGAKLYRVCPRI